MSLYIQQYKDTLRVHLNEASSISLSKAQTAFLSSINNWHVRVIDFKRSDFWTFRNLKERGLFNEQPMNHVLPCKRGHGFFLTENGFKIVRYLTGSRLGFYLVGAPTFASNTTPASLPAYVLQRMYKEGGYTVEDFNSASLNSLRTDLLGFMYEARLVNRIDTPIVTLSKSGVEFCESIN